MNESDSSGAWSRTNAKHWIGVDAEDIPQGWMDDMVRRLFDVLNREMIRLETAQASISDKKDAFGNPPPYDVVEAEKRARLARQMQTSLEKLRAMEEAGAQKRKPKVVRTDEQALQELERRIDQLIAAHANSSATAKSDGG